MGKARKRRYRKRFYNFLRTCCCSAHPDEDDTEDIYERNENNLIQDKQDVKASLLESNDYSDDDSRNPYAGNKALPIQDEEDVKASLLESNDHSDADSRNSYAEVTFSEASIFSNEPVRNHGSSSDSAGHNQEEQCETSPKRPDSFKDEIPPNYKPEEREIMKRLAEQSQKLDKILGKLEDSRNLMSLRYHVQNFRTSLDRDLRSNYSTTSSRQESRCFTHRTISETREAAEHDEEEDLSMSEHSPRAFCVADTDIKKPISPSQSRLPKEHDCSITSPHNSSSGYESSELAEIISQQFEEIQKCSREQQTPSSKGADEVKKVIQQMKTEVESLQGVTRRQDAGILRTRSFVRCSYPSPITQGNPGATEIIEMNEFSRR